MPEDEIDWEQEYVEAIQRLGEVKAELQRLREKFPPYHGIRDPDGSMRDGPQLTAAVLLEILDAQQKVLGTQKRVDRIKRFLRDSDR